MKTKILIALISCIATLAIAAFLLEFKAQKDQLHADALLRIESVHLNESRNILVHLPRGYTKDNQSRYPIIYALDGTSHDRNIAGAIRTLNDANVIDDYIVVGIPNTNRNQNLTPPFIHSGEDQSRLGEGDTFLKFLEEELIPQIEATYRSNGIKVLSGHSRAGLFTYYSYLENTNLFDAYFCFSPALWRSDQAIIKHTMQYNPLNNNSFIYMSMGENENTKMMNSFNDLREHYMSKDTTTNIIFDYTKDADHGSNPIYSIPRALLEWSIHMKSDT